MNYQLEEELRILRKRIKERLESAEHQIIEEETLKILGRVKIVTHATLDSNSYTWFIEPEKKKMEE